MSYRVVDEDFSRGFLTLRVFTSSVIWFAREDLALSDEIIVEASVLPKIDFEVCQQVEILVLFEDLCSCA